MKITDLGGKYVSVKISNGEIFKGFVEFVETEADADDGVSSIDLKGTKQFPYNDVNLRDDEIVSFKIINKKDIQ
ncbi:hypothetical protein FD29_GL000580 [Companilactobacillus mindensis DSM 14500]|uniref:LSM domain-containing protein n=1 Tax=Companilactobacillus mindensis DSM 14500 TaxID=1423770 RepID=A0A0R1QKL9_9LACO|nr:hypothetical protein [Companilactobacillus mindensis]KRL45325.1 hypothetical protein FD29_GL000580 [Companilactobacillus mindensis DSM 14500]GEO79094.1 hypothetical protein LMI01_14250 [Companilactobacillus mindensis]